jgi:hypothetical protein
LYTSVQQWSGTVDGRFDELGRQLAAKFESLDATIDGAVQHAIDIAASGTLVDRLERLYEQQSRDHDAAMARMLSMENHMGDLVARISFVDDTANQAKARGVANASALSLV